jgi:hypothetical protein
MYSDHDCLDDNIYLNDYIKDYPEIEITRS